MDGCSHLVTFDHIGHLVFAHGFESLSLHLAFKLRRDAEEVDGYSSESDNGG